MAILAACDPTIPVNAGLNERIDFVFPEASVVNPRHPATMNLYFPTAHLVYNTVLSALAKINPKRAVAPSGLGSGAVTIGYRKARGGKPAVLYELLNTSLGGTSAHDGVAVVMAMNHFTPGAPVEIVESEYPLRVRRLRNGARFGGRGNVSRRPRLCARIRGAGGQRPDGAFVEPQDRVEGLGRRRLAAIVARRGQPGRRPIRRNSGRWRRAS